MMRLKIIRWEVNKKEMYCLEILTWTLPLKDSNYFMFERPYVRSNAQ